MHPVDIAALLLRAYSITMLAPAGITRSAAARSAPPWTSIGMRPAWVRPRGDRHEIGSGVLLLLGLLTPLAAAGILGTMLVALVTAHLKNRFFIFRRARGMSTC
jgi:putative oxidoreductase